MDEVVLRHFQETADAVGFTRSELDAIEKDIASKLEPAIKTAAATYDALEASGQALLAFFGRPLVNWNWAGSGRSRPSSDGAARAEAQLAVHLYAD
jgi:hypothetical protein